MIIVRDSKITTTFGLDHGNVLFFINNIRSNEKTYMYNDSMWNVNLSMGCIRIIITDINFNNINFNNINYYWDFNENDINGKDPKLLSLKKIRNNVTITIPKQINKKLKVDTSPTSIAYEDEYKDEDKVLSPFHNIINSVISFFIPAIPE